MRMMEPDSEIIPFFTGGTEPAEDGRRGRLSCRPRYGRAALLAVAVVVLSACSARMPIPAPFEQPIESRLILQVPYFSDDGDAGGPAALAEVLTYNGRPSDPGKVRLALDGRAAAPQIMVVMARQEGLKAQYLRAVPADLLAAVRQNQPAIVRLDAPAPPLRRGDYAVVVGYTPEGPVVNSGHINQQIVPWSEFLAGWHKGDNTFIMIEPN